MIIIYPMLCSGSIAESTLPAISKTVERYLIVYYMTDILKDYNEYFEEGVKLTEDQLLEVDGVPPGAGRGNKSGHPSPRIDTINIDTINITKDDKDKKKDKMELKMDVSQPTIELAPTYVTVTTKHGTAVVGVKVVPIRVKSDIDFTYYLEKDSDLNYIMGMAVSMGRYSLRLIYKLYDKYVGRFAGGQTPSGDARHDIIYSRSGFSDRDKGKNVKGIVLVDKNQMSENFMKTPGQIHKMQNLGWDNLILADDVNRYAHFCMKKFRGMCNSIPYQMMYRALGGQDQVYDSIEQARMKNASLFKTGPSLRRLIGETIAFNRKSEYIWNENDSFLLELGLEDIPHKLNAVKIKSISSDISEKVKSNDFKGAYNLLKTFGIKEDFMNTAFEKGKIEDPELEQSQELAIKVMKNSLPRETMKNQKLVDAVSKYLSFAASLRKKKYGNSTRKAMKELLEDYIPKVKSFYDEQKEELENKDSKRPRAAIYHTMEAAIGIVAISTIGTAIFTVLYLVATNAWTFIGIFAAIMGILGLTKMLLASITDGVRSTTTAITTT